MALRALFVSAAWGLGLAGSVAAQVAPLTQGPPDPQATTLEDITVVGTATQRAMGTYVRAIGSGPTGRLTPRWDNRLCIRVIDMDAEHADLLRNRIETVAEAIGLSPDRSPTCSPVISIYASNDPDGLATALIEAAPRRFRPARSNTTLGDAALDAFRTSDAPVRWWQVSLPVMVDTGQLAMSLEAEDTQDPMALSVTVRNGSRLRGNVRDDLMGVTIIVDARKLNGVPFGAVSDYIAFVALAPADPRAPTASFDTVLNLFDRPGVTGLTAMDQDYLYALYAASRAPGSAGLQAAEIAQLMTAERHRRQGG